MADRSLIIQAAKQYSYSKAFYFLPADELKPKQITGAINKWAKSLRPADVIILMDTTLFSSGKEGFLLTERDLHAHILYDAVLPLEGMSRATFNDSYITVTYHNGKVEKFYASIFAEDITSYLNLLIGLVKEADDRKKAAQEAENRRRARPQPADPVETTRLPVASVGQIQTNSGSGFALDMSDDVWVSAADAASTPASGSDETRQTPAEPDFSFLQDEAEATPAATEKPTQFSFCPYCDAINPQGVRVCATCGAFLPGNLETDIRSPGGSKKDLFQDDIEGGKSLKSW